MNDCLFSKGRDGLENRGTRSLADDGGGGGLAGQDWFT